MIINSQLGGKKPTGTMYIISNGTYNVADKAIANVQVPTSNITRYGSDVRAFLGEIDANGILQKPTTPQFDLVFTGVKGFTAYEPTVGVLLRRFQNLETIKSVSFPDLKTINTAYAMTNAFYKCTGITSVDLSSLQTITGQQAINNAFYGCTNLTTVDMGALTSINANNSANQCFSDCTSLTSVDLHSLTYAKNISSMFKNTTSLESIDLSALTNWYEGSNVFENSGIKSINLKNLTSLGGSGNYSASNIFKGCSRLEKVKFESLTSVGNNGNWLPGQLFGQCTSLTEVAFYGVNNATFTNTSNICFESWLTGCTGVTVRFPMRVQTKLTTFSNVTSGLGGTNTTVLFDIVTTVYGANSVSYNRKESESTATAIAWISGSTLYYTAGTTEPVVGATIYSDAACTTAVTTVASLT